MGRLVWTSPKYTYTVIPIFYLPLFSSEAKTTIVRHKNIWGITPPLPPTIKLCLWCNGILGVLWVTLSRYLDWHLLCKLLAGLYIEWNTANGPSHGEQQKGHPWQLWCTAGSCEALWHFVSCGDSFQTVGPGPTQNQFWNTKCAHIWQNTFDKVLAAWRGLYKHMATERRTKYKQRYSMVTEFNEISLGWWPRKMVKQFNQAGLHIKCLIYQMTFQWLNTEINWCSTKIGLKS